MSHTITFRDGSKLEVTDAPHDDGADRQGWVAVTSLEPDANGNLEHVAHWIDTGEIASVT